MFFSLLLKYISINHIIYPAFLLYQSKALDEIIVYNEKVVTHTKGVKALRICTFTLAVSSLEPF